MGHAENCNAEIVRSIRVLPVRILLSIPPVIQDFDSHFNGNQMAAVVDHIEHVHSEGLTFPAASI